MLVEFGAVWPIRPFAAVQIGLAGPAVRALRPAAAQTRLLVAVSSADGVEQIVADLLEALHWRPELAKPFVEQIA